MTATVVAAGDLADDTDPAVARAYCPLCGASLCEDLHATAAVGRQGLYTSAAVGQLVVAHLAACDRATRYLRATAELAVRGWVESDWPRLVRRARDLSAALAIAGHPRVADFVRQYAALADRRLPRTPGGDPAGDHDAGGGP